MGKIYTVMPRKRLVQIGKSVTRPTLLAILDGLVLHQGAISIFTLILFCPIQLLCALPLIGSKEKRSARLSRVLRYGVAAMLVLLYLQFDRARARFKAEEVIKACQQYKEEQGKYPEKLEVLVPKYIPQIPHANFSLMYNEFQYWIHNGQASLIYPVMPPFGRATYNFESKTWNGVD